MKYILTVLSAKVLADLFSEMKLNTFFVIKNLVFSDTYIFTESAFLLGRLWG